MGSAAAIGAFIGLLLLLLGPISNLLVTADVQRLEPTQRVAALNSIRQLLLTGLAGLVAGGTIALGVRTYLTNRRMQVSERYAKAIGMLASDKLDERLGGIYALEHIMRESPPDHEVVVEVLVAFIREHSSERLRPIPPDVTVTADPNSRWTDDGNLREPDEPSAAFTVGSDIQAAIDVIGRRPIRPERLKLDFRDCDLIAANFERAMLNNATFHNCNLDRANFRDAAMYRAAFSQCHAAGVSFQSADLQGAHFHRSTITYAGYRGANISMLTITLSDITHSDFIASEASVVSLSHSDARGALPSDKWTKCRIMGGSISKEIALTGMVTPEYRVARETVVWDGSFEEPSLRVPYGEFSRETRLEELLETRLNLTSPENDPPE